MYRNQRKWKCVSHVKKLASARNRSWLRGETDNLVVRHRHSDIAYRQKTQYVVEICINT